VLSRNLLFRKESAYLRRIARADERTRTADLISLRVGLRLSLCVLSRTGTWLTEGEHSAAAAPTGLLRTGPYQPGCSTVAVRSRISRPLPCCGLLRFPLPMVSAWCQQAMAYASRWHLCSCRRLALSETLQRMFPVVVHSVVCCPESRLLLVWLDMRHGYQWQPQVANLGQHAVQRGLVHNLPRKYGLSVLQVGDL
jgi:hypothetical protein